MEIKKPTTANTPKPSTASTAGKVGSQGTRDLKKTSVDTGIAKERRAKAAGTTQGVAAKKVVRTQRTEEEIKAVVEYAKRFKDLIDQSVQLLDSYAKTKSELRETIRTEKKELTPGQVRMLAELDKKTLDCKDKMSRLSEMMEKAVASGNTNLLEKICETTNAFVVDKLGGISQEYADLMLRIVSEDEELTAQLNEIMEGRIVIEEAKIEEEPKVETEAAEEKPVKTAEVSETKAVEEPKPLSWADSFWAVFYGPGDQGKL